MEKFLRDGDQDFIGQQLAEIGKLQSSVYKYENEVLTLAGVGQEYDKVRKTTLVVCEAIQWLEEVLCVAIVDPSDVEKMYKGGEFDFQRQKE